MVFLKGGGREGGGGPADTFPISFFQGLSFLHLAITFPLESSAMHFKKKIFFYHHNCMKKGHSKLSKNEPEDIP